ncbi:hypothetical protein AFGD_003033 [Aspergillus flavus]|nr:hypothetical protein AFGD_003033 [Aspergillus flavus]
MVDQSPRGDNRPAAQPPDPSPSQPYYVYSSRAGHDGVLKVQPGSNIDNFLSFFDKQRLALDSDFGSMINLHDSDYLLHWLRKVYENAEASVKITGSPNREIESFHLAFNLPFENAPYVAFSSSVDALKSSFSELEGHEDALLNVPRPGIDAKGKRLYCGLDETKTSNKFSTTVKDILNFVGQHGLAERMHPLITAMKVTFDKSNTKDNRNALWYNPGFGSQMTLRLQFQLDLATAFKGLLESHLKGFTLKKAHVICKKIVVAGEFVSGIGVVEQGGAAFHGECSITPSGVEPLTMALSIEFDHDSINLILEPPPDGNILETMLAWMEDLVKSNSSSPSPFTDQDDLFENVKVRRISINLYTGGSAKGLQFEMTDFDIDVEVAANFGKNTKDFPVFLLSYGWQKGRGKIGSFRGQLWTGIDPADCDILSPHYESWKTLVPATTSSPAKSIDLKHLIPGNTIDNIPEFIPTKITQASLYLSQDTFFIGATIATREPNSATPHPNLGEVSLNVMYSWGKTKEFSVTLGLMVSLKRGQSPDKPDRTVLTGQLEYDDGTWKLKGGLEGFQASSLYEFFDGDSASQIMPLIESIVIHDLNVDYTYSQQGNGHSLAINGSLLVGGVSLRLEYKYEDGWSFVAKAEFQNPDVTMGDVVSDIIDDDDLQLPDFLANLRFGKKTSIEIKIEKQDGDESSNPPKSSSFQFITDIKIGDLEVTFIQYRDQAWTNPKGSKRLIRVSLRALPQIPKIEPFGDFQHPFDEISYLWVQDPVTDSQDKLQGLTRKEIEQLNEVLVEDKLLLKDDVKERKESDVLLGAGSHFVVLMKDATGGRSCLLDYNFLKAPNSSRPTQSNTTGNRQIAATATHARQEESDSEAPAQVPLKKRIGPFALNAISFKYSKNMLHILIDATVVLGPVEASVIGFDIGVGIGRLDKISIDSVDITGMSVAFNEPPLTIAGAIQHGSTATMNYYSGALIVGFDDYLFKAAGFYGEVHPEGRDPFKSLFLFARLDGPLFRLSFAEISGITGGFGYNSDIRAPKANQVINFPFLAERKKASVQEESTVETMQRWMHPDSGGWFQVKEDSYWAAAGLKINAFRMLSLDAVIVVFFGTSIKLGVFGVATFDSPYANSKIKFAHVELNIAVMVDFDYGTLKMDGQLSPTSYILHPDCHLTGGFALYSWFDGPQSDQSQVGNFVFTMGGYHRAFDPPVEYPRASPLAISWSYGSAISITGKAYFAITPKTCMGGCQLRLAFSAGPIKAWLDASADFLMNYQPFYFIAELKVSVGISFTISAWIVHSTISAEVGADLTLWGPPMAGQVHVDFWVTSFDIKFGEGQAKPSPLTLLDFYQLVLETASQPAGQNNTLQSRNRASRPINEGHIFLAQSGLLGTEAGPPESPNERWVVRGGTFSLKVCCKMALGKLTVGNETIEEDQRIYAKPMQLTSPMTSDMTVTITQGDQDYASKWKIKKQTQPLPTALWGIYNEALDPSSGSNHIDELLNTSGSTIRLMTGISLTVPPPETSTDKLGVLPSESKAVEELISEKSFPQLTMSNPDWEPDDTHVDERDPWDTVYKHWDNPVLGRGEDGQAGFADAWIRAMKWDCKLMESLTPAFPERMKRGFNHLFVGAPAIGK